MDYIREYKRFVNSYYLSEGVRITAGILLPAIILNHFGLLIVGVVVSLGALCVSVTDNPGPIHHRRNGMLICSGLIFLVSLATGSASPYPVLLGLVIALFCFLFSLIAVYGSRAISVGVAALLVMVLNIDRSYRGWELLQHSLYILAGGLWYTGLSLLLYGFRPYRLLQQALGECIMGTADYLRVRADFYAQGVDYEKVYREMMDQQVRVHQEQELVRELLFKSRSVIRESTQTGRTLVMLFVDIVDLFERIMTSYQDYQALHAYFDQEEILPAFRGLVLDMAAALDEVGLAVKSGRPSAPDDSLHLGLARLREQLDSLRDRRRTPDNLEGFISLRNILQSMEDIETRIQTLRAYSTYDKRLLSTAQPPIEYERFISHQDYSLKQLTDQLSGDSNIFRHALRVSLATLAGYLVSKLLPFGHSYWILLTIIVILKPAYSLTKKRNYQRLLGTIAGACLGFGILYLVHNNTLLLAIMMVLMIGTYSFLRTRYMLAVILMTPYILLLFHLLYQTRFEAIVLDRVLDTAIGSVLALLANSYLLPVWEHQKIADYMVAMLEKNAAYFRTIAAAFVDRPASRTDYKVSRKEAFVSLANLSDAFARMLSEPRSKQKRARDLHQFVALNHMLTSHIATLSVYATRLGPRYRSPDFMPAVQGILDTLGRARAILLDRTEPATPGPGGRDEEPMIRFAPALERRVTGLMRQRQEEIQAGLGDTETRRELSGLKSVTDQFRFIATVSVDIRKICGRIRQAPGA
ncbi:MAG TPA: FUSC family membrane protein [Chitinophagaceae bacterium]|nr:FUSC family membrane protein [Chitinophagaceae bacterium]